MRVFNFFNFFAGTLLACGIISALVPAAFAFVYNTTGPSCSVPLPRPTAPLPACAPDPSATLELAQSLAPEYAPEVRFHPLERYHLQTIETFWNAAELYLTDYRPRGSSAWDFMFSSPIDSILLTPRSYVTVLNSSKVTPEERAAILAGAPFDSANRSTANVHYTVVDADVDPNYWVYNFIQFYSWNGCSNQVTAVSMNGTAELTNYIMCPVGVHEGDIERVSVLVCKSDRQAKRISYSQHGWSEERDCTLPPDDPRGCPRNPETGNFVTHAGLEGHGNYPASSPLDVYEVVTGSIAGAPVSLDNLGGVYISDRTLIDPYKRWEPTPDNLVYIPPPSVIADNNLTEFEWALYGGNWGAPLRLPEMTLWCFENEEQTSLSECAQNTTSVKTILALSNVLGVVGLVEKQEGGGSSTSSASSGSASGDAGVESDGTEILLGGPYTTRLPSNTTVVSYPSIPGPMTRGFSYLWVANATAPIQTSHNTTTLTCPVDLELQDAIPEDIYFSTSISTITAYLIGIAVGDFLFSLLLVLLLILPTLLDKTTNVREMVGRGMSTTAKFVGSAPAAMVKALQTNDASVAPQPTIAEDKALDTTSDASISPANENNAFAADAIVPGVVAAAPLPRLGAAGSTRDDEEAVLAAASPEPSLNRQLLSSDPSALSLASEGTESSLAELLDLEEIDSRRASGGPRYHNIVWGFLAAGLFISGMVLLVIGAAGLFNQSVVSAVTEALHVTGVANTFRIIMVVGICLVAVLDISVMFMIFVVQPDTFRCGRWRIQNRMGGRHALLRKTFEIFVVNSGLMVLVVCISTILFALGLTVTIVQLGLRVACKAALNVEVLGSSVKEVCISIPSISADNVCGWQVLEVCSEVTSMKVRYLMIGAALWIWGHLIFLVMLVASLEHYREHRVMLKRHKRRQRASTA